MSLILNSVAELEILDFMRHCVRLLLVFLMNSILIEASFICILYLENLQF